MGAVTRVAPTRGKHAIRPAARLVVVETCLLLERPGSLLRVDDDHHRREQKADAKHTRRRLLGSPGRATNPMASVSAFLEACGRGDVDDAGRCLVRVAEAAVGDAVSRRCVSTARRKTVQRRYFARARRAASPRRGSASTTARKLTGRRRSKKARRRCTSRARMAKSKQCAYSSTAARTSTRRRTGVVRRSTWPVGAATPTRLAWSSTAAPSSTGLTKLV